MSKHHQNLRTRMRSEIFAAFSEGTDKHDLKSKGEGEDKVFSYGSKFKYLDRINDFCQYVPKGIRDPKDLTSAHVTAYLDAKAASGKCTQGTLDEYRSQMKIIGRICGIDLSVPRVVTTGRKSVSNRGADSVISGRDLAALLEYGDKHPSKSALCVRLESLIGVRVSELSARITVGDNELIIKGKNGKVFSRPLTHELRSVVESDAFKACYDPDGAFRPIKDDSINKYLRRTEDKLGLERHSCHDIRRRVAQDKYDELRHSGLSRSEALSAVSLWLGHGLNREKMILKSYIGNAW